ncbi:hypothetical protein QR680_000366 [Steinernema hermaphroditum]|uniref:Major facilitator superfamily (MFS) profile domain-containing protein n=1 Tax=Steinernema hermaphroditum TaxID=289476 RepID=A0AA39LDH0_9BILA|nr:hypothetical protein QR680_000366 [Steinernema hermaphroditum]
MLVAGERSMPDRRLLSLITNFDIYPYSRNNSMIMANESEKGKVPASDAEQKEMLLAHEEAATKLNKESGEQLKGEFTNALLLAVVVITVGSSFQFGYHIGCVNAPGKLITKWYIDSQTDASGNSITAETADFYWSVTVAIFAVSGMMGGLLSGWVADKIGRKGALFFNNFIAIAAAAFMTSAKFVDIWYLLPVGRFIIGFNCGLNSGIVPMYLTEVSPINLRGMIGSVHQLLVTISILIAQIFGLPYLLGNEAMWPYIFAFTVVPAVFQLATLSLVPESPKYTLIVKNNPDRAETDLKKLRGKENVSAELDVMRDEVEAARSQPKIAMGDMFKAPLLWPLCIAIMMMLSQQLSGINAAMFFSTAIFRDAGLEGNAAFYATIGMGTVNVLQTIVSLWLVDHPKFGRRFLHITGLSGMLFSSILIVVSLSLFNSGKSADPNAVNEYKWASYMAIIFVLLFVISFATGPGSIPWFFVSEIFASSARGNANSIAVLVNWAANFAVGLLFLPIKNWIDQYSFLVFSFFLTIFIFFTWKFVPETKGKTIDEINKELARKR